MPYLKLFGTVAGGWLMARAALVAATKLETPEADFYRAKKITARFYAEHVLPEAQVYRRGHRQRRRLGSRAGRIAVLSPP